MNDYINWSSRFWTWPKTGRCGASPTQHFSPQRTSWLMSIMLFFLISISNLSFAQTVFEDGFESGNTDASTTISGWTNTTVTGSNWVVNKTLTSYNRTPRTGTTAVTLRYGRSAWLFKQVTLTGGQLYSFSCYARQDGTTTSNASVRLAYGSTATAAGMTNTIVTTPIGSSYLLITGTFTPATSGTYFVGILGTINSTPWYITLDDVLLNALNPCTGTPVAGTLNNASQFICSGATTAPSAISLSGFSTDTGISFQWEESLDNGTTWNNVTAGTGATTATYTPPVATQNIGYRAKVTCSGSGESSYSSVHQITMVTCTYDTSYTPGGVAYQSIMPAKGGTGGVAFSGWQGTSGDDNVSTTQSLAGTTFKYQGQSVTGFQASSNGWMTFNTANTSL